MRKIGLIIFGVFVFYVNVKAQYMYPLAEYNATTKNPTLTNFDITDTILYLPLGESGLHIINIADIKNFDEIAVFTEYEKRSRNKVYGFANNVKVIENKVYLSFGPLGLKILDATDPNMPYPIGNYYRYQDVYSVEIFENFAFLGYVDMGLEIVDLSDLDNIKMVSRNNIKDFTVKNIQIFPPYVVVSGGNRGLRIFKFQDPFTSFKQSEFPKDFLIENESNKFLARAKTGYIANDFRGLSVLNIGLPLYPLEVKSIKTAGKATNMILDRNYLYVVCGKSIEVYDIKEPESPVKISEYVDKDKKFEGLKMHNNKLFASFSTGGKNYGIMVFQVE